MKNKTTKLTLAQQATALREVHDRTGQPAILRGQPSALKRLLKRDRILATRCIGISGNRLFIGKPVAA